MEARREQYVQQTAPTNHQCLGESWVLYHKHSRLQPLQPDQIDCGKYRGLSLLFVAGKNIARILLSRLSTNITQCGFRQNIMSTVLRLSNRSTVDMICCLLRQLQEKCIEQDRPLYMVDFSKAFYTVARTGLWQLLRKYGCPEKFTTMIDALHNGMVANVSVGGKSQNRSVLQMGSSKVVYWPPRSSPSSCQQPSRRLSDTWGMVSTYSPDIVLTYSTSHTSE